MYLTRQPGALAGEARRANGASAGERAEHARSARLAPARRRTTAEAAVETLALHGTELFFGVPGVHNDPLFDALHRARDRVRVLHARHEQAGGYMALGAALATGRPQAFAAVPGPGVLNASAALLTAYGMGAPVLALCGQIPSFALERGLGHLHEVPDQLGILRHLTKHAARITGPQEASARVAEALSLALSGRRRPVALECAMDVWGQAGPAPLLGPIPPLMPTIDEDAVEQAARILGRARRPLILVGGGALGAAEEVRLVAKMLEAPVGSFRRGRGVLDTRHRLAVNYPQAHRLWATADAVLAVGTRLHAPQSGWGVDEDLQIVRLDVDPEEPARQRPPACAIVADAAAGLRALLARLPRHNLARPSREEELAGHRAWLAERLARLEPQMGFLRAMRAALPEDGILVDEVTQVGFAARLAFPVPGPRLFFSGHQENLGYGYGTALGAAAACPGRAVLSIAGDGGFAYQAMELATAKLHNLPAVVVVFDDGAFGNVKRIQQEAYGGRLIASELRNPDWAAFAATFGVASYTARTEAELEARLREAFALRAPALVHVPVGAMPSAWDMILMPAVRGRPDRPQLP